MTRRAFVPFTPTDDEEALMPARRKQNPAWRPVKTTKKPAGRIGKAVAAVALIAYGLRAERRSGTDRRKGSTGRRGRR